MSIAAASARRARADCPIGSWPFFAQEYLRIMRSRLAMLIWAMLLYTLVALPFLMAKPPPELLQPLRSWLGSEAVQAKLILFMWVDAAMNKFAVILGPGAGRRHHRRGAGARHARSPGRQADRRGRLLHGQARSGRRRVRHLLRGSLHRRAPHLSLAHRRI